MTEPIAIIGIGCRYPQAGSAAELWRLLMQSGDAIHDYNEQRFAEMDAFYAASARRQGGAAVHRGGFLPSIDRFDSQFFELAPREAMFMDPQFRLLMEVTWEALEDAGQVREKYEGSRTGVFIGLSAGEYESHLYHSSSELDFYMLIGGGRASASGRLSYTFGLEGPSFTVDTACSSSLVAIHQACQALRAGEVEMSLAGGVHIMTGIHSTQLFMQANMLARDGRCKFGDASGDGFVRSEGCGVIVLKRLSDAIAANDPIYATIRGSAVNNDGRTNGLMMTPSSEGQQKMLHQAWKNAGIEPQQVKYIEAHGTGTSVGDPIEIGAIGKALTDAGVRQACLLGSIKSNIGHTEAASGVAGLIKSALALHHRMLPPSLHFHRPNPNIPWASLPVQMVTEPIDLSAETQPIFAGINSFGLTGTNAHIILEEFRPKRFEPSENTGPYLFALSAHTQEALHARIATYSTFLRDRDQTDSLHDICHTAGTRRTHLDHRIAVVAENKEDLDSKLAATLTQQPCEGVTVGRRNYGRHRVVFVAPGQGSQWVGMARDLFRTEAAFRDVLTRCDAAIQSETGWSVIERALGPAAAEHLLEIDVVQPALFAISVALAALWRFWGVEPNAVVGHSMGEVAAAHIGGALSLHDAASVICRRSRLMKTISGSGAMATIELTPAEVERYIHVMPGVSIAAMNSPGTTVVSGDPSEIDSLLNMLELKEVFCRRIKVDVASHSAQVDPILQELTKQLIHIQPKDAVIPVFSTVTGEYVSGREMDTDYWASNLREPVLFAKAIDALAQDGHDVYIELSPHPILIPAMESTLRAVKPEALLLASLRRDKPERASMLASLGSLFVAGHAIDWAHIHGGQGNCVSLPAYPFQRERCWPDASMLLGSTDRTRSEDRLNPLLGSKFESSLQPGTILWEADFDLSRFPYLKDHRVRESIVLPASAHIETALEAVRALHPEDLFDVVDLQLLSAIQLSETERQQFQIALIASGNESFTFETRSRSENGDGAWTLHSSGKLEPHTRAGSQSIVSLADMQHDGSRHSSADDHYRAMTARGIQYGPAFRLFAEAWSDDAGSLCRIQAVQEDVNGFSYVMHPALLDACFQSLSRVGPISTENGVTDTYLPVAIGRLSRFGEIPPGQDLFVHVSAVAAKSSADTFDLDLRVMDSAGAVLVEVQSLKAQRVSSKPQDDISDLLFDMEWIADTEVPATPSLTAMADKHWLILADNSGVAEMLAATVTQNGGRPTLVQTEQNSPDHLDKLFQELANNPPSTVVHMSAVRAAATGHSAQTSAGLDVARVAQAIVKANWQEAPRLCFVTNGAFALDGDQAIPALHASTVWGMGLVVARELPELRVCMVDLSQVCDADEIECLAETILSSEMEERIALRGKTRFVARLVHATGPVVEVATETLHAEDEFRLEISEPGILDNLALRAIRREKPGPGEVAIEVSAVGLNFIDVTKAMGIYPGLDPALSFHFGVECAGRVAAIGSDVTAFDIDDEVVAITSDLHANGVFASYVILPIALVARKPRHLSMEEAAAAPIAYLTAYHSLVKLANIQAEEWVLIPSAAGGVGLAAIEIAQQLGAHVIATAGTSEKQEYLKARGVVHVLPSRSLDFAEQALAITGGRGVDIVLNSLTGEFITKSLEILAPYGRFIELGKRDIYDDRRIGLKLFRNNLSYHVVDIGAFLRDRQWALSLLFQHSIRQIDEGTWRALPVQAFPVSEPEKPFHYMATAKHIGKLAIVMDRSVKVLPRKDKQLFCTDGSYIITGAFGGVGSAVAEWMAENGAGNLVLVSRRKSSTETLELVRRIEERGAVATHIEADVSNEKDVSDLISTVRTQMPQLRGIMHTAAIIDDALIKDLDSQRYEPVMGAKVEGAWNLHSATLDSALDFFVLFSSAAAIYTQPGMGSYAAANAFLDALARYRRAQGFAAASVNWGGWDGIGLAREAGTKRSLAGFEEQGLRSFSKDEGLHCLREILQRNSLQTVVFRFDPGEFAQFHAQSGIPRLFNKLTQGAKSGNIDPSQHPAIRESLISAPSMSSRIEVLEAYLQEQLSSVLRCSPDRIDRDRTLGAMGLDSLMALEFVRRLNTGLGIALPATSVFNYPTIKLLAQQIIVKMRLSTDSEPAVVSAEKAEHRSSTSMADDLSEEEALRELMYPGEAVDER